VVKNVAGYDVPKLFAGSRGTLGFITQVTFKVKPVPEATAHLLFSTSSWQALHERLANLALSAVRPTIIEVIRERFHDTQARPSAVITLQGPAEAVEWQASAAMDLLRGGGAMIGRVNKPPLAPTTGEVEVVTRVRPSATAEVAEWLAANSFRGSAAYYPMEGRLLICTQPQQETLETLAALRERVEAGGGAVTIERMPLAWSGKVDPWGTPRADYPLARAIKTSLDPSNIFPRNAPGLS
jgi:glycolate oxidase FAD binding subunit